MSHFTKELEKTRNWKNISGDEKKYPVSSFSKAGVDPFQISDFFQSSGRRLDHDHKPTDLIKEMSMCTSLLPFPEEWVYIISDNIGTTSMRSVINLVLAPALAAVGFKVQVISGQSLDYTGKFSNYLECIPGFRACLSLKDISETLNSCGCCIAGKTGDFDPADKILHQCQKITGEIKYPPLIVATIISNKFCEEITALLYDVKYGTGSIFLTKMEAEETARNLLQHSKCQKTTVLITSMQNTFRKCIGNSLEIAEAILCLKGRGSTDIIQFACSLGSELLQLMRNAPSKESGMKTIMDVIENGMALKKFCSMIIHQGVVLEIAHLLCSTNGFFILPKAQFQTDIIYDGEDGFVQEINFLRLAMIYKEVSAKCHHDPVIGLILLKCFGDKLNKGEVWIKISHQGNIITDEMQAHFKKSISVGQHQKERILIDRKLSTYSLF